MKPQAALGNTERGMGARYKGRGFIQLTGRSNYLAYAARASAPRIVDKPVEGGTPETAGRILAAYSLHSYKRILGALKRRDFVAARQVVNGKRALHHDVFAAAYRLGEAATSAPTTGPLGRLTPESAR